MPNRTKKLRYDGFRCAYEGLLFTVSTQKHMKFHMLAALFSLGLGLFFRLSAFEYTLLVLTITLVTAAECMNTAIEKTVDLIMPNSHPGAKAAKDTAAAAVLLTAVFAAAAGIYLFAEPVFALILDAQRPAQQPFYFMTGIAILYTVFVALLGGQAWALNAKIKWVPSLLFGMLAAGLALTVYLISQWVYFTVMILLYVIIAGLRIKQTQAFYTIASGGLLGVVTTLLLIWLHF